jgi:hypothetical protein
MSESGSSHPSSEQDGSADVRRREALIKLGKYTAYATPILLGTVTAAQAASAPAPTPGPAPSDIRLKRDIVLLRRLQNRLGLYRYRYLSSDTVYVGVMAQEVERIVPDAVVSGQDGYLRVDYARLGMRLLTWDEWMLAERERSLAAA